ncbi:MAG: hypothetical protein QOF04_3744, partial [Solirubrobacteraceae bacterium]|nr:hypothetical protein [Solirubrobacteraceae bacterium]
MLLRELVERSAGVAATGARRGKVELLAVRLRRADAAEA